MRSGAFFVLLWICAPVAGLAAQDPDSLPRPLRGQDSVRLLPQVPDTVADDTLGPPPPTLPTLEPLGPATSSRGVWEWDYEALRRLPDLSLLHLLERVPGVVPVRADIANQPEAAVVFGATAGGIRYVVDGFELDPLGGPTFDPSRLPLLALDRVRIERGVTGATVYVRTMTPDDPRPRTLIEAGTGDYDVQLFRGTFLAPSVLGGPLAVGFERLASDGVAAGSSNHTGGWVKWSWVRDSAGVQAQYRQSGMDRSGIGVGEEETGGQEGTRRDWMVRARAARGPVTGEIYAGASHLEEDRGDVVIREGIPHGGLRLGATLPAPFPVEARTAIRLRDHPRLPFGEIEASVHAQPHPLGALEAEVSQGWWNEGPGTGRWLARARTGPVQGVSAFAEVFAGSPLAGALSFRAPATPGSDPIELTRDGLRAGAELRLGELAVTGAALRTTADLVTGFGLSTEASFPRLGGGQATGVELMARLPTGWDPLRIAGWYVGMDAPADRLYLPTHHWRAGLVYHQLPLPSGNLEIFARVEHVFRGRMTVPGAVDDVEDPPPFTLAEVGAYRATNLELTIRVLTVRAFLRWENMLHRLGQHDLPGFMLPGQRVLYGVKWEFVN